MYVLTCARSCAGEAKTRATSRALREMLTPSTDGSVRFIVLTAASACRVCTCAWVCWHVCACVRAPRAGVPGHRLLCAGACSARSKPRLCCRCPRAPAGD